MIAVFSVPRTDAGTFLFDAAHNQTAGNADWIIDADIRNYRVNESNAQKTPTGPASAITAATPETYWSGGLSAWGVALAKRGYNVESIPTSETGFGDAFFYHPLYRAKVLVICEPNNFFSYTEKQKIVNFVADGGGLFIIADHDVSDRNGDGVDSVDVWNDLFTNNGVAVNPFGMSVNYNNFSQTSTNLDASGPFTTGLAGTATSLKFSAGASFTIDPTANASVRGVAWTNGARTNANVMMGHATYGLGRVVMLGDSSPPDDGTGDPNDNLFFGWNEASHATLIRNASDWLYDNNHSRWVSATPGSVGQWSDPNGWTGNVPDAPGTIAEIGSDGFSQLTLQLDAPRTVGVLSFTGTSATLGGSATLTLQPATAGGGVEVRSGFSSGYIEVPLQLDAPTTINIGSFVSIAHLLPTPMPIVKSGNGTLRFHSDELDLASLDVRAGRVESFARLTTIASLQLGADAQLAVGHVYPAEPGVSGLLIGTLDGVAPTPAVVRPLLQSYRLSSGPYDRVLAYALASEVGFTSFLGGPVEPTTLLLRTTYPGDANFDDAIDFDDLLTLAQNYEASAEPLAYWIDGDFTYDGLVNFDDLLILAQFYGYAPPQAEPTFSPAFASDWALARSLVPEPSGVVALAMLRMVKRRR